MIYCLFGTEKILIDRFVDDKLRSFSISNVSKYNLEDENILNALNDLSYIDIFDEKKAIIIETKDYFKKEDENKLKLLEKYLLNPNDNTYLFLLIYSDSLDERKKITKILREKYEVYEFNKLKYGELDKYIINSFKNEGYQIDNKALKLFTNYIGQNVALIYTEIDKLKIYKIDDKNICEEDIMKVVKKEPSDMFRLIDAVFNSDKELMLICYQELLDSKIEDMQILLMLANEFRILYQVKILYSEGKNEYDIAKSLNIHSYRVKLAINRISKYKEEKILKYIYDLSLLDEKIKLGLLSKENILLDFFLEL